MSLKNKVVLVSGGTRGIGYAIVKGFLDSGARVVLLGSRKESVDRALTKLKNENEAYEVLGYYPDLSKENEIVEMLEDVKKKLAASVDILVNNAGISDAKSIYEYDDTHFADVMQVNVDAMFMCSDDERKRQGGCHQYEFHGFTLCTNFGQCVPYKQIRGKRNDEVFGKRTW